jgi:hypothetical protein
VYPIRTCDPVFTNPTGRELDGGVISRIPKEQTVWREIFRKFDHLKVIAENKYVNRKFHAERVNSPSRMEHDWMRGSRSDETDNFIT